MRERVLQTYRRECRTVGCTQQHVDASVILCAPRLRARISIAPELRQLGPLVAVPGLVDQRLSLRSMRRHPTREPGCARWHLLAEGLFGRRFPAQETLRRQAQLVQVALIVRTSRKYFLFLCRALRKEDANLAHGPALTQVVVVVVVVQIPFCSGTIRRAAEEGPFWWPWSFAKLSVEGRDIFFHVCGLWQRVG